MANFLILDANNLAVNCVIVDIPQGGHMIPYEGPFWHGQPFDGTTVLDPNPIETVDNAVKTL